jgi:hypothetical protein
MARMAQGAEEEIHEDILFISSDPNEKEDFSDK